MPLMRYGLSSLGRLEDRGPAGTGRRRGGASAAWRRAGPSGGSNSLRSGSSSAASNAFLANAQALFGPPLGRPVGVAHPGHALHRGGARIPAICSISPGEAWMRCASIAPMTTRRHGRRMIDHVRAAGRARRPADRDPHGYRRAQMPDGGGLGRLRPQGAPCPATACCSAARHRPRSSRFAFRATCTMPEIFDRLDSRRRGSMSMTAGSPDVIEALDEAGAVLVIERDEGRRRQAEGRRRG